MRRLTLGVSLPVLVLCSFGSAASNPFPRIECTAKFEDETLVKMMQTIDKDPDDPRLIFTAAQGDVEAKVRIYFPFGGGPQPYCHFSIQDFVRGIGLEAKGILDPSNEEGMGSACRAAMETNMRDNKWISVSCQTSQGPPAQATSDPKLINYL